MKSKTNLFVCVLIALSINLQCNISAYAAEENDITATEEQSLDTTLNTEVTEDKEAANAEIIDGADLSVHVFAQDDQTQ